MQQPSPLNKNFKSGTSIHSEVKWDNKTEASSEDEQSISDVSDPEELENNNSLLSPTSTMPSGTSSRPVSTLVSPLPKASESTPGTPISGESPSKQSNDNPSKLGTLSRAFNMFKRKPKDKESVDSNNALAPPVPQKLAMQEKETIVKSKLEDKGESPVPTPEPRKLQPKKNESEETKVQMITDEDDFDISDLSASLDHID